jgi:ferredoxin/flavodoxin
MKIAIRYFTGTGNTARACAIVSETFSSAGWEVDVQELRPDRTSLTDLDDADLLLAAFPVLGFSPPASVSRWLGRLPKEKGKKAAVLAVVGATVVQNRYIPGWGADAPFSAARLLGRRGWEVVGIGEVSYPDNFTQATNPPTPEQCREIRERNDPETLAYALALEEAARTGNRPPMLSRSRAVRIPFALIAFLFRWSGRPILSRTFIADDGCNGCGLCARACPSKAIRLRAGRPEWSLRCVSCNRCVNVCPTGSIVTSTLAASIQLFVSVFFFAIALSVPLPKDLLPVAQAAVRMLLVAAFLLLQEGPVSLLLRRLSRTERLKPFFRSSFMKNFRRYTDDGFTKDA